MTLKNLVLVFVSFLFLTSCLECIDPVDPSSSGYRNDLFGDAPVVESSSSTLKNVLIEDFTGHTCGNCPLAALTAKNIAEANPGRVFVSAIHAGGFTATDDDKYSTDWTCEDGLIYWDQLDFQANPLGRVNREGGQGNFLIEAEWEQRTNDQLAEDAVLTLAMENSYHPDEGILNVHVNGTFLEDFNTPVSLAIMITESELYGYQLDYSQPSDQQNVPDYHFEHTLRGTVSGALGLNLAETGTAGESIQKDYSKTWDNLWIPANCSLIAYAYRTDNGEILNVVEQHVHE